MKHKTFSVVLVLTMAMMGCLKVQKKSEVATKQAQAQAKTPQPKQAITRELRLDDVFVEFEGQPQPDVYNMVFSWPETRDRVRVSVNGQLMFAVQTSERQSEAVANLQGGKKVAVLIEVLDQQYHVITSEVRDLDVPKDYVFPNQFKLTGNMKIQNERVFMNNSVVTTENFNLDIQTKKLIILDKSSSLDKSTIQNFVPGAKAKVGNDGRSGGLIRIDAEFAEGDLMFIMNSEAGGDALKGFFWNYASGTGAILANAVCTFGTNGFTAGHNGDLILKVKEIKNFRHYIQETLSEGGKLAPVLRNPDIDPDYPSLSMETLRSDSCPNRPSLGAGATTGKICLTFSGQTPAQGCE